MAQQLVGLADRVLLFLPTSSRYPAIQGALSGPIRPPLSSPHSFLHPPSSSCTNPHTCASCSFLGYNALKDYFPTMDIKPNTACVNSRCLALQKEVRGLAGRLGGCVLSCIFLL